MLTCQEVTELVTEYLEGRMSWWDRVRFRLHVLMCAGCRAYLHDRRLAIETLGRLPPEPIPPEVRDDLLEAFRTWKRNR